MDGYICIWGKDHYSDGAILFMCMQTNSTNCAGAAGLNYRIDGQNVVKWLGSKMLQLMNDTPAGGQLVHGRNKTQDN
jgi:hypothetical protein